MIQIDYFHLRGTVGMRGLLSAVCLTSALLAGTASWAATIEPVRGQVSFNQGAGFQKVDGRVEANTGDSVMVGPDGAATVVYSDGCTVDVQPGAVVTIAPLSPCASGSFAQASTQLPSLTVGAALAGAAVIGAGAFIGYEATRTTSGPAPASP